MKSYRIAIVLIALTAIVCSSCKKVEKPEGMPEIYPCVVKLTQEGAPLADASILCSSDDPNLARWAVTGKTDASGVAKLFTMGKYEGAPAGAFAVVVTKEETEGGSGAGDPGEMQSAAPTGDVYSLVTLEQTASSTTPHKMTVEASKENSFEFDCGEKVRVQRPKETN